MIFYLTYNKSQGCQVDLSAMSAIVIRALSVLSSSHYLDKISKDACILHYKRSPTWRSLAVLIGLWSGLIYLSSQSPYFYVRIFCYVIGSYFCYITTEKYEEVIFDKSKKTASIMGARFLEKWILGYRRIIVVELEDVVAVSVETQKVSPITGYVVVLLLFSGMTLALTSQCTYGDRKEHETISKEITEFLGKKAQKNEKNRTKKNN